MPGAIATGITAAISTSITRITLTVTTLTTSIVAISTAAKPGVVSGNTIRSTAAVLLTEIGARPISMVAELANSPPAVQAIVRAEGELV